MTPGQKPPPVAEQAGQFAAASLKDRFEPFMVWDAARKAAVTVTRDDFGPAFDALGVKPDLRGRGSVKLADGAKVEVRTVFDLTEQYLKDNMTPAHAEKITGAPAAAVEALARQIAANPEKTLFAMGMGPNQFFNADLKDRAVFLVAALTRNVGFAGGNVGSYAGNYRAAIFGGMPAYVLEDPFNLQLDPAGKPSVRKTFHYESAHYYNYGDRPLRVADRLFTGQGHMPTPTKAMWLNNSNSIIGNVKWHYDVVNNTLPGLEFIAYADWWWTGSCEYADIVFGCDSWAEFKHPDMTASCTNPFVQMFPVSPLKRVYDTRSDMEILAGVADALSRVYGDKRFGDTFAFVAQDKVESYLQRIIDGSPGLKGYKVEELHQKAKEGIPALVNNRSYPRISSFEQAKGERPWHTRTGRLEFYRPEIEFMDSGENLVVYREPIDSTHREPNVLVAKSHPAMRPVSPESFGLKRSDLSSESRQVRNVVLTVEELMKSKHPLKALNFTHVYHTPKYRHGAHTTPVDTDFTGVLFGPFGDVYRHDKRMPSVTEGYVDLNPLDARAMGVDDGDYVYVDADPSDRPFRGFRPGTEEYKVARLMLRVRFYPGTPRGVARTWHNMYGASFGSVKGHEGRDDGLARSPETNYQAMFRYGSHQSATRAWLRPTLMTETLIHKDMYGQGVTEGFAADIHCPVGAPRESFVKFTRAESGGMGGDGLWRPAALGLRPTYENANMKQYLAGAFARVRR